MNSVSGALFSLGLSFYKGHIKMREKKPQNKTTKKNPKLAGTSYLRNKKFFGLLIFRIFLLQSLSGNISSLLQCWKESVV